jgi:hypothetical protein
MITRRSLDSKLSLLQVAGVRTLPPSSNMRVRGSLITSAQGKHGAGLTGYFRRTWGIPGTVPDRNLNHASVTEGHRQVAIRWPRSFELISLPHFTASGLQKRVAALAVRCALCASLPSNPMTRTALCAVRKGMRPSRQSRVSSPGACRPRRLRQLHRRLRRVQLSSPRIRWRDSHPVA